MNEKDLQKIGARIQNRRKQQGYTQETLAEKMNVSEMTIHRDLDYLEEMKYLYNGFIK